MIDRYRVPEIHRIWQLQSKFEYFLRVELALLEVLDGTLLPTGVSTAFSEVCIDTEKIAQIEQRTHHDVIAFCESIALQVKPEVSRYFHFGVTSSDIIDTALSLQMKDSLSEVIKNLQRLLEALDHKITQTDHMIGMGRSHGKNASPMRFSHKWRSATAEFQRRLMDYQQLMRDELTGQISGAVGNYPILPQWVEKKVCEKLGLAVETVSTQVIPRDRLAKIVGVGSLLAAGIYRLATEIRLLSHSDVNEVAEGVSVGQKGSSTMPHKKNPIKAENLCGIARVIMSHHDIALMNVPLWHERDITHSSAERLTLPDHFELLCYSLKTATTLLNQLVIFENNIIAKVQNDLSHYSNLFLHRLIVNTPYSREILYEIIQKASFQLKPNDELSKFMALIIETAKSLNAPVTQADLTTLGSFEG